MIQVLAAALITELAARLEHEGRELPCDLHPEVDCNRPWGEAVYDRKTGETPKVLVFLDVDGVLNSTEWAHERVNLRDGRMIRKVYAQFVKRLNRIHETVEGVGYVLTSSSRLIHFGALKKLLQAQGFTGSIVDMTPRVLNGSREQEIAAWLEEKRPPFSVSVVVLDDTPVSLNADLPTLIVRVDASQGLTVDDVDLVLTFLTE